MKKNKKSQKEHHYLSRRLEKIVLYTLDWPEWVWLRCDEVFGTNFTFTIKEE